MCYRREVQPLPNLGPFQARLDALLGEGEARLWREKLHITRIHDLRLREAFGGILRCGTPLCGPSAAGTSSGRSECAAVHPAVVSYPATVTMSFTCGSAPASFTPCEGASDAG